MKKTKFLVQAAVIAAMYAALTMFVPVAYENPQIRISEALTVLPLFTPAAIPGLFIGCIVANLFSPVGVLDIVFGSLATLIAAFLSYKMPKRWLVPFPPVIVNAVIIGLLLTYIFKTPLLLNMGGVAVGQAAACYGLGYPLILLLEKHKDKIFK